MSRVHVMMFVLVLSLFPLAAEAQQVFRDEASFLAAAGVVAFEGFESYPTEQCRVAGTMAATAFATSTFNVTNTPLNVDGAYLCIGNETTGPDTYGAKPTEGNNALVAWSDAGEMVLTFTLRGKKRAYAVGFYLTNHNYSNGPAIFTTNTGQQAIAVPCCLEGLEPAFFGFISSTPFTSFTLGHENWVDAWGIDEVMLGYRKPRR
jgi:hypothetical protein